MKPNSQLNQMSSKSKAQINKLKYGIQYTISVLGLFSGIKEFFEKIDTNKKFQINDILFSSTVDDMIVKSLLSEHQSQKQNMEGKRDQNNFLKDWNFSNEEQIKTKDKLILQLLDYFKSYIQKEKGRSGETKEQKQENKSKEGKQKEGQKKKEKRFETVQGDFDIIIGDQDFKTNNKINQFLTDELKEQGWILSDYLEVMKILNLNQDSKTKFIFQLKRNPFRISEETITAIQNWKNKNISKKQDKNAEQQNKKPQTFIQIFQKRLLEDNMLENISQIIKLLYAGIHLHFQQQKQKLRANYDDFLTMRIKKENKFTREIKSKHPVIVIYYILNSNISQQNFKKKFDFFFPLLRHIFIQNGAILNVVGYNPLDQFEILKRKIDEQTKLRQSMQEQFQAQKIKNKNLSQQMSELKIRLKALQQKKKNEG